MPNASKKNASTVEHKSLATAALIKLQAQVGSVASPAWLTRVAARRWARQRDPARVAKFITEYGIDHTAADRCTTANTPSNCAEKYGSLNEFFIRKLHGGVRPDRAAVVVSPASCVCVLYRDEASSSVWVKGRKWSLVDLVRLPMPDAVLPVGIFRLRPADYHRFHSPLDGTIARMRRMAGTYLSVDPTVVRSRQNPLTENARVSVAIDTPYGRAYFVAVGAAGVGAVKMSVKAGDVVRRGDELGYFEFGGSTVVVLLPPGLAWDDAIVRASLRGKETYVTVGQAVGQAVGGIDK